MGEQRARLGQVLYPVADIAAAVEFYEAAFGFTTKFADGNRFAGLDTNDTTLALTGPAEDVTEGVSAAAIKVHDVGATVEAVVQAGGSITRAPRPGPHELRAVVRDPWENALVIYGPI